MASDNFKAPGSIPQDLLLIHDLIGDTLQPSHNREAVQEDISSSSSDTDSLASEDEIEAELMKNATEDGIKSSNVMYILSLSKKDNLSQNCNSPPALSSHSGDSDSEESVSDSDSRPGDVVKAAATLEESEDDEEGVQTQPSVHLHTKNELINVSINIPDIQEVGPEETMEKVGEVMSIVDNVVIVKALSSGVANRGSDKALDTDTLLVFDDRTILGYVRPWSSRLIGLIHTCSGRSTNHLVLRHSHCTKSDSTMRSPLTRKGFKCRGKYFMFLRVVISYFCGRSRN